MSNPNDRPSNALIPPPENSAEVSAAFAMLAQADALEVPKMPEMMFIEHILPSLSAPAGTKVDLTKWLDVAGTPIRPIDVVDNVTGDVIFRVPPLMRSLPTVYQEEMRYAEIVMDTQAREVGQHAVVAERYLGSQLSRARTGATLLDVETASQWNLIRKRYDLPLLPINGVDGKPIHPAGNLAGHSISSSSGELAVSEEQEDF